VGIKFDDQSVDLSGVSDQRGRGIGGPVAIGGGGLGIVGLIVFLLINVLGGGSGIDTTQLVPQDGSVQGQGTGEGDLETRCNTAGAIDKYDDCYLVKVYNEVNEVWTDEFARAARSTTQPGLTFFTQAVNTGCGQASSQVGPVLLPAGPDDLHRHRLPAAAAAAVRCPGPLRAGLHPGPRGRSTTCRRCSAPSARSGPPSRPIRASRTELSVAMELQADCYAGVWSKLADDAGNVSIGDAEVQQAQDAAAPWETTGSSSRPRAGWTRSPGPTGRRRSASSGSPPDAPPAT
jgi:hypothetical protein